LGGARIKPRPGRSDGGGRGGKGKSAWEADLISVNNGAGARDKRTKSTKTAHIPRIICAQSRDTRGREKRRKWVMGN